MNNTGKNQYQQNPHKKVIENLYDVYTFGLINTKISLHISEIGKNLKNNLETKLISKISNKCIPEGYVKPNSIKIQSYSAGLLNMSEYIEYHVIYQCMICHPVEGMLVNSTVKHITKAGLHCNVIDNNSNIPIVVFIIRENSVLNNLFLSIKENDLIQIRIIGIRFELNDPYISAIGELQGFVGGSGGEVNQDTL
jgi:DNA-directed RNA polymerase subunit E'/Rpb7